MQYKRTGFDQICFRKKMLNQLYLCRWWLVSSRSIKCTESYWCGSLSCGTKDKKKILSWGGRSKNKTCGCLVRCFRSKTRGKRRWRKSVSRESSRRNVGLGLVDLKGRQQTVGGVQELEWEGENVVPFSSQRNRGSATPHWRADFANTSYIKRWQNNQFRCSYHLLVAAQWNLLINNFL